MIDGDVALYSEYREAAYELGCLEQGKGVLVSANGGCYSREKAKNVLENALARFNGGINDTRRKGVSPADVLLEAATTARENAKKALIAFDSIPCTFDLPEGSTSRVLLPHNPEDADSQQGGRSGRLRTST